MEAPWDYPQRVSAQDWKRAAHSEHDQLTCQLVLSQARKHGDLDILTHSARAEMTTPTRFDELLRKAIRKWSSWHTPATEVVFATTGRPGLLIDGTAHRMTFQGTSGRFVHLEPGDMELPVALGKAVLVRFFECDDPSESEWLNTTN